MQRIIETYIPDNQGIINCSGFESGPGSGNGFGDGSGNG